MRIDPAQTRSAAITTIIPTYRRPKFLRRALRSVLAQTYENLTVCVYDNASGDETSDVVSSFAAQDPRIQYHCHSENIGAIANFNYGMNRVATPYFSMLSDDDVLMPEFYARAMSSLAQYPTAGSFCAKTLVYESGQHRIRPQSSSWQDGYYEGSIDNLLHMIADHFVSTGVVFKTEVKDKIGLLNSFGSDHIYMTQVLNAYPIVVSDYGGAVFTAHGLPVSAGTFKTARERQEWLLCFVQALLRMESRSANDRLRCVNAIHEIAKHVLVNDCVTALREGRIGDFRAALSECRAFGIPAGARIRLSSADWLLRRNEFPRKELLRLALFLIELEVKGSHDAAGSSETDGRVLQYLTSLNDTPM